MDPFLGEIRLFAGNYAPDGWALCNGQIMGITQNTALFALLGTLYGGDGRTTFALPDFKGKAPVHFGQGPGLSNRNIGETDGAQSVTLLVSELPAHTHIPNSASVTNGVSDPTGAVWTNSSGLSGQRIYEAAPNTSMSPAAIQPAGGSAPHNNMQPYLGLNFIIALRGIFPPRS